MIYLAQTDDPDLDNRACACADELGLAFERVTTTYGDLEPAIVTISTRHRRRKGARLMPRRGRGGPGLTTIYWRDIPAQVTATTEDGGKEQVLMHDRFQVAIDRAAAVAGLTKTDDYVNEWRRGGHERRGRCDRRRPRRSPTTRQ